MDHQKGRSLVTAPSPFRVNRFELETSHNLYYLPPEVFPILEASKSTYLVGSRGTGKTTLMKALSWEEQLSNPFLKQQLDGDISTRRYIGLYLRVPEHQSASFSKWMPGADPHLKAAIFSLYLDLLWLEGLVDAITTLCHRRILRFPAAAEYSVTAGAIARHPEISCGADHTDKFTLKHFGALLHSRRRELENFAVSNVVIPAADLTRSFPLGTVGDFGRSVGASLESLCRDNSTLGKSAPWHFKVCLDEAECLDSLHRLAINTAVRLTAAPVSYVVSYIRPIQEMTETLIPNLTLQKADREVVLLDEKYNDKAFTRLAEGVSTVRVQHLSGMKELIFNTESVLGHLDINALLSGILKDSEDPQAQQLLALANELAPRIKTVEASTDDLESTHPPIYQAYIVDRLRLTLPTDASTKEHRAQASAELRKRMVAAYLCICSQVNQQVRYAFAEMVLQMSDKCIRDYLDQMHEIFVKTGLDVAAFTAAHVAADLQDAALKAASKKKKEHIPSSGVGSPAETVRIVDGLAQLTARLQTTLRDNRGLRSSERGLFLLKTSTGEAALELVQRLLKQAAEAGFLRIVDEGLDEWQFRVHCSLAAAYGFSYRGAYYSTRIRLPDLAALYQETDSKRRAEIINEIGAAISGDLAALPLFDGPPSAESGQ
jgi:hypothetical protein